MIPSSCCLKQKKFVIWIEEITCNRFVLFFSICIKSQGCDSVQINYVKRLFFFFRSYKLIQRATDFTDFTVLYFYFVWIFVVITMMKCYIQVPLFIKPFYVRVNKYVVIVIQGFFIFASILWPSWPSNGPRRLSSSSFFPLIR